MLEPAVVTALVLLLSALAKQFLPDFPISDALINSIVVALLSWLGLEVGKYALPTATKDAARKRGLLK